MKSTIQTFRKSSNSDIKRRIDVDDVVYDAFALTFEHLDSPPSIQETLRENLLNRWREAKLLSVILKIQTCLRTTLFLHLWSHQLRAYDVCQATLLILRLMLPHQAIP